MLVPLFKSEQKIKAKYLNFIFLLFFTSFINKSYCQNISERYIDQILGEIIENTTTEYDFSELVDHLVYLSKHPLSLNSATKEDLEAISFLSSQQIADILEYRDKYLGFATVYELKLISSLDVKTIRWLVAFTNVKEYDIREKDSLSHYLNKGDQQIRLKYERTFEDQEGYLRKIKNDTSGSYYLGSPDKLYCRYNYSYYNKLSAGITMEKDPGEEFFRGSQKTGFDFYSAHVFLTGKKLIKTLALGDFQINLGQGVVFRSGFSTGKNSSVIDIFKVSNEISAFKSVNEFNYLRGCATTIQFSKFRITSFFSSKAIDGTSIIDSSISGDNSYLSSFYVTGYHRTQDELIKRNQNNERIAGLHLTYNAEKLKLGLTFVDGKYELPLLPEQKLYNFYRFKGDRFTVFGADYTYTYKNILLFGETGFDGNNFAHLYGALTQVSDQVSAGLIYRNYPKSYQSPYANPFRENSTASNEKGVYFALSIKPTSSLTINTYFDNFQFPWLTYNADFAAKGYEYLMNITWQPSFYFFINLRFKYSNKERNKIENLSPIDYLANQENTNIRCQLNYRASRQISLDTRLEMNKYLDGKLNKGNGYLTQQDISWKSKNYKTKVIVRYAVFSVDSYYARIYSFENDLPSSFSFYMFSDKGARYYLLFNYRISSNVNLWFKISRTNYLNKDKIGSGLTEIQGSNKTDFKFQINWDL